MKRNFNKAASLLMDLDEKKTVRGFYFLVMAGLFLGLALSISIGNLG